jgi:hypothetical protein
LGHLQPQKKKKGKSLTMAVQFAKISNVHFSTLLVVTDVRLEQ